MPKRDAVSVDGDTHQNEVVRTVKSKKIKEDDIVDRVNHLSHQDFRSAYVNEDWLLLRECDATSSVRIELVSTKELEAIDLDACYNLIEHTSRADYEASAWGWHPRTKRKEMRDPDMRYLLLRTVPRHQSSADLSSTVLGFLSFMITYDSTPAVPVLYIYEIHLSSSLRGRGLGAHLMSIAEKIANTLGLTKVMLTCFLSNGSALSFYRGRGYDIDVCSPTDRKTRTRVVKVDYAIMSKDIEREE